ncbi:MAG: MetQ/NlpA family ABC transporter substrate-binding protein [Paenibacillus dendritiformis]|uniref:MetQ/NlpA family ABC transporter substrate-binding protein n=1 Tax=Paenibacillus dendritiformis TaxID=130049 RepID=UPI00143CEC69|nr:MetQ/NlpA family ABC transporter substrate-binding protein [Paenibacillus dendritiformis]MDU5141704.1 MetQ/NlpA family ABC transporter substrate-binding protein [Paenibacillus dendritiformis]NKI21648.1 MetQ/NlpA family ABC transporter substrate-binding protein [Paenibacillus dendritiformis]NRF97968.1 MetQ/NlpA family ABC transporter substrate-binding protein [Paenibacillus dendritiformis]
MKKWTYVLTLIALIGLLAACGSKSSTGTDTGSANEAGAEGGKETVKLVVGASPVPHAEILKHIAPKLKEQGIELEVKEFTDYVQPNVQVHEKQLDANFFQHKPYMDNEVTEKGYDLVSVGNVHVEPFGGYSKSIKSIDELKDGDTVAIPNDPTNGGRSLLLLEKQGLIKLKEGAGLNAGVKDIAENPKNLKFKELEAAMLPRTLDEVNLALINTNYALEAGLNPTKDALFIEDKESPYANILTARSDNKDSDAIQKLLAALQSDDVKQFIGEKYEGSIVPAF